MFTRGTKLTGRFEQSRPLRRRLENGMNASSAQGRKGAAPEQGDFVFARGKSWIVERAEKAGSVQTLHLVSCEDDSQGEAIQLAFATELQTQVLDPNDWSPLLAGRTRLSASWSRRAARSGSLRRPALHCTPCRPQSSKCPARLRSSFPTSMLASPRREPALSLIRVRL